MLSPYDIKEWWDEVIAARNFPVPPGVLDHGENMCVFRIENLTAAAREGAARKIILDNVNIRIGENRITCLIGESGAGKTLLSRIISGLPPKDIHILSGKFFYREKEVSPRELEKMRGSHIFYTPQNAGASLNPVLKIKSQVRDFAKIEDPQVCRIFDSLGIEDPDRVLNAYPFELSGGENQRCLLAIAVLLRPDLLILDEPTASLDAGSRDHLVTLIKKIQEEYHFTILVISHDLSFVGALSDHLYIIKEGKIIEEGPVKKMLAAPRHAYTREIVDYFNRVRASP